MANVVSTKITVDANSAKAAFKSIGSSIRNNVALGNLMATGITAGLNSITSAVGNVVSAYGEAASIQSSAIATSGDFARLTGKSFKESQVYIDDFTDKMSQVASALPGATADYVELGTGIMDNLIPAYQGLNGILDEESFNKSLESITTSAGLRAAASGIEAKDAALAISKTLGGSSLSELKQLRFFEASPAAMSFLEKGLEELGTDLKGATAKQRADVLQGALGVEDEVIEEFNNSFDGLVQGFKSGLLDPNGGMFGLMRTLDDGSTVMSITQNTLKLIIGENGLFAKMGEVLSAMGISFDPMEVVADGLFRLNNFIEGVGDWLDKLKDRFKGAASLGDFDISEIGSKLGEFAAGIGNKLLRSVVNLDGKEIGNRLGKFIAGAFNYIAAFIRTIDFTLIAKAALGVGIVLANALTSTVANIDWGSAAISLLKMGLVAAAALGAALLGALSGLGVAVTAAVGIALTAAVGVIGSIREFFEKHTNPIKAAVEGLGNAIRNLIQGIKDKMLSLLTVFKGSDGPSGFTGRGRPVPNAATGMNAGGLLAAARRERAAMPSGAQLVVANSTETILNRDQRGQLGGGLSVGAINIHAGSAPNPKLLVKQVMEELEVEWTRFQRSQMTGSFG